MIAKLRALFKYHSNDGDKNPILPSSATPSLTSTSKIVIVGSGCFGISTALHLLWRGYKDVTVLERALELPAADAASTDINKIVRSSYKDEFYTRLAREAIEAWRNREVWGDNYYETGVLVCGTSASLNADSAFQNDIRNGAPVKQLITMVETDATVADAERNTSKLESISLSEVFHPDVPLGPNVTHTYGYLNADGGWVHSKASVERAMELVKKLGGTIIAGKEVASILKRKSRTKGVKCKDGSEFTADVVVLATGSWTASAFPQLNLGKRAYATGQSIVTIKLTAEEQERYRSVPVVLDFGPTGFYCFPPNGDNLLKVGSHIGGYANVVPISDSPDVDAVGACISTPRTILSHGADGLKIPKSEAQFLRKCLRQIFPELAEKPFHSTRLCWYTDSPDSNWIIDVHPNDPGLAVVTSGSGHGFKFLPVIGRLVVDRLEGKMDESTRKRFAIDREFAQHTSYREGAVIDPLSVDELVGAGEDC